MNSKESSTKCTPQPTSCGANVPKDLDQLKCASVEPTIESGCSAVATPSCGQTIESNPRLKEALTFAWALFKRIFPYVLVGALISAVSAIFVPDTWVQKHLGSDSPLAIPIAATIGIPLYLRIEMAIPILKALIVKGMSMGAAMALIIGGTGASLPEIAIISSMLKPKAIAAFIVSVLTMAMVGALSFTFSFRTK